MYAAAQTPIGKNQFPAPPLLELQAWRCVWSVAEWMRAQKLFFKFFTIVHGLNEAIFGNGVWPASCCGRRIDTSVASKPALGLFQSDVFECHDISSVACQATFHPIFKRQSSDHGRPRGATCSPSMSTMWMGYCQLSGSAVEPRQQNFLLPESHQPWVPAVGRLMLPPGGSVGGSRQRQVPGSRPGPTQSLRLTPKVSSFFAYESLRFAAFAAVSVAAWTALGPFCAAALINPNL